MSLLDTASLIVTPNAVKEGKLYSVIPSDGSGDMSVTRATTATRVNSAGLVELVPYNLVQYSEQLDNPSFWFTVNTTITPNTTIAPNGTLTADTLTNSSTGYGLFSVVSVAPSTQYTFSFYVKKGTNTSYILSVIDATTFAGIDSLDYSAQVGTEWVRVSTTFTTLSGTTSIRVYPMRDGSSTGTAFLWGAQLVEGSTAKDYQKTETRLNIPRLEYSNGTCPSLLVEPQRTNVCRDSNNLSGGSWLNQTTNTTITRIQSGGPDGNAFDRLVVGGASGSNQGRFVQFTTNVGSSAVYSVYVRGTGTGFIGLFNGASSPATAFTLTNEWVRYDAISTSGSGTYIDWAIYVLGGSTCDVAFHQVEFGNYSTSYIPTTSASVTRNADVISKTGISSLIGQTEGTLFVDVNLDETSDFNGWFLKENATFDTFVFLQRESNGIIAVGYYGSGALQARIETAPGQPSGHYKIAFGYKNNDFVMYINGTQIGTDTSGSVSGLMDYIDLHWTQTGTNHQNAVALWPTRLTNTQLAQLTTI
jgi:hypothetical protein